ncbi:hypothetical protein [Arsenicicoccus dermatophilus]|uniref:hypothetical protein n=1 Tax=Arsenicicoccus dermatophilus TaxID=1076331 RepID=UPI0039172CAF
MSYEVSPLRAADAEVIGPGHNRVWRVAYRGLLPDEVLDARSDEDSTRRWRDRGRQHEQTGRSAEGATTELAGTGTTELRMVRGVSPASERPCGRSASR